MGINKAGKNQMPRQIQALTGKAAGRPQTGDPAASDLYIELCRFLRPESDSGAGQYHGRASHSATKSAGTPAASSNRWSLPARRNISFSGSPKHGSRRLIKVRLAFAPAFARSSSV